MFFSRNANTTRRLSQNSKFGGNGLEALESREMKTAAMDLGLSAPEPPAQMAAYIKFDGVDGESSDKGHGQWIELNSFTQPPTQARAAYIKFDGVDGESSDKGHGQWIELNSFTQPPTQARAAYIKFDGVDGESSDKDHGKWIELNSMHG